MSDLNRALVDNLALVVGLLGVLIIGLAITAFVQSRRLRSATEAFRGLLSDGHGGSLQQVLEAHLGKVVEVGTQLERLSQLHEYLEVRSRGSIQHVGLVRFNPFEDTGSDQSFAIALLDDRPGGLADVLERLEAAGVNVEYLYCYVRPGGDVAVDIFRVEDPDAATDALQQGGFALVRAGEIYEPDAA